MRFTKRHDFSKSSAPKLFSTIPTNLGTTLATLCNMVGQKRVMGNRGKISARFFATLQLAGFLPAIWGQNHRLVQVEESEDEVCRALSCDKRKRWSDEVSNRQKGNDLSGVWGIFGDDCWDYINSIQFDISYHWKIWYKWIANDNTMRLYHIISIDGLSW